MKGYVVLAFVASVSAARLSNNYLPPTGAQNAGGSPGSLTAPGVELARSSSSSNYNAPRPQTYNNPQAQAYILRQDSDVNDQGFHYAYETSDGTKAEQQGQIFRGAKEEEGSISVQGSYSYVGDDGQTYSVRYIADENGFRAEGDHLPTPPPIPEAILKSLQQTQNSNGGYQTQQRQSSYSSQSGYKY